MVTVRQIERLWNSKSYQRLWDDLIAARSERAFASVLQPLRPAVVAAMAMIRLDELSQSDHRFYSQLVRAVVGAQEADGGWGDVASTALCLRGLLCSNGAGAAIQRGLAYLASLQKPSGLWPAIPLRRMPEDADVSLFVLTQLGNVPAFQQAVLFAAAVNWFAERAGSLDPRCQSAWEWTSRRCRSAARQLEASPLFAA